MQEEDRKALRSNREALLKDLQAKRVASLLYSRDIFSEEDKDSVNAKSTPAEQREEVLDILPRKGPEAFGVFCDVLREVSPHLAALLRPIQEDGKVFWLLRCEVVSTHVCLIVILCGSFLRSPIEIWLLNYF